MIYGYARVSTQDQDLSAQLDALTRHGCAKIYSEKASGAKTDRPEIRKAIKTLAAGDVLVVTRIDRLARSTRDLLNTLKEIEERGATFLSLHDKNIDTSTPSGMLLLSVLSSIAAFERDLISARTGEGRTRAKARGVKFGRKSKLTAHQMQEARERKASGEAYVDIAKSFDVDPSTISRLK